LGFNKKNEQGDWIYEGLCNKNCAGTTFDVRRIKKNDPCNRA
jgi:hypothetical protein